MLRANAAGCLTWSLRVKAVSPVQNPNLYGVKGVSWHSKLCDM